MFYFLSVGKLPGKKSVTQNYRHIQIILKRKLNILLLVGTPTGGMVVPILYLI